MAWAVWWHRLGFLKRKTLPDRLPWGSVAQIDALLARESAPGLLSYMLAAEVEQDWVSARDVAAGLRSLRGARLRVAGAERIRSCSATTRVIAFNAWGEAFVLNRIAEQTSDPEWATQWLDGDGLVSHQWQGPWRRLRRELGLIDECWFLSFAPEQPDVLTDDEDGAHFVDAPFWHLRKETVLIVGSGLLISAMGVVTPLGFQAFTDKVLPFQAQSSLVVVVVMLTLAIFATGVLEAATDYLEGVTSARLQQRLGVEVIQRLLKMPVSYFDQTHAGEVTKLTDQVAEVAQFQVRQLLSSVVSLVSLVVVLPLLLLYHVGLTLMVLGVGLLMALTVALSLRVYRKKVATAYRLDAGFQSGLIELVKGIRTVKALTLERHMANRQIRRLDFQLFGGFDVERLGHLLRAFVNTQSRMVAVLILAVGAQASFKGEFSVGQLIAFYMLSDRLIQPLVSLVMAVNGWQKYRLAKEKLSELSKPADPGVSAVTQSAVSGPSALVGMDGDICFEDVWFRYPGSEVDVLKGVSFRVSEGRKVGVVGESGSGKSTLLLLLQGFYRPTRGRITLGGVDLCDFTLEDLRRQFSVVSQGSFLFNLSVFENIRLGRLSASAQDVWAALAAAHCHTFVEAMPGRYGALLSEDGLNLSGGQRQRLAIARAFLRDAPIMLFDEATSALDQQTEDAIKLGMRRVCDGKTTIMIAHRWSTLSDCHDIVVMAQGQVMETGAPDQVLPKLQSRINEDTDALRIV